LERESEESLVGTATRRSTGSTSSPSAGHATAADLTSRSDRDARRERVRALVALLDDESPSVVEIVQDELQRSGRAALAGLLRGQADPRPRVRSRSRALVYAIERQAALRRLLRFACQESIDLERGLFLMSRLDSPDFDRRPYVRVLDALADEVRERSRREEDILTRCMVLTQYLGNELGFIGSESDFDHPANVFLHRTLERKRGMPLTLTAIYLLVARRVGIRAAAIPLPGRVMLRLYAGRRTLIVDPFQGGRLRTRSECARYLERQDLVPNPAWFRDATDAALFQRQLLNLMNSYQLRGLSRTARALHRIAAVVARRNAPSDGALPA